MWRSWRSTFRDVGLRRRLRDFEQRPDGLGDRDRIVVEATSGHSNDPEPSALQIRIPDAISFERRPRPVVRVSVQLDYEAAIAPEGSS
jgi:hypothetical protein